MGTAADPEVLVLTDRAALAWEAAARVAGAGQAAVRERGRFTLALSGGNTPLELYRLLAMSEWLVRVPWEQTHIFWADERCVPPDHPDSNYGAARAALLDRLPVPPEQIHRWYGEAPEPASEAARYAGELRAHTESDAAGMPRIDLLLLGMGPDGHTASLFPHSPTLKVTEVPTAAPHVSERGGYRLTLTFPVLNAARSAVFLVSGEGKAETLARVLEGPSTPDELPAQAVRPRGGTLAWLVDAAAASQLSRTLHGRRS